MDPDPLDRWNDGASESESDSNRTFAAFEGSQVAPPKPKPRERSPEEPGGTVAQDRSLETPAETGATDRSLETSAQTEARPMSWSGPETPSGLRTPSTARTKRSSSGYGSGSGSSFIGEWDDDEALPADADGNLFGKYHVIRKLGGGGMGYVLLVEHVGLRQPRALKIIKSEVADNETNRLRFQQEAIILAKLSRHPNAVVVYDTGFVGKFAYIDMDFQEGQTLRQRLEQTGPMPARDVLWILGEICAVLGEAHRQKIVHRDIKPQNVMIVPDASSPRGERVKVLDFGIAKIVREAAGETYASLTQDHMGVLGTIPYSSPEQLGLLETGETQSVVDHRSDIYSLGVMLYEMLAGARPFTGTQTKILYDHAHTAPPSFAELVPGVAIPPEVEAVVRRCLEKDPAERHQSVRELFENFSKAAGVEPALETILPVAYKPRAEEELPVVVAKPSFLEDLSTFLARHQRAVRGGLAAAAIVLVALAALAIRNRLPGPPPPQPIAEWLRGQGFEPDLKGGLGPGGWPRRIQEISGVPRRRKVLAGKYYIPEGFEPDSPSGTETKTGLPKVLVREGRRFILLDGDTFVMGNFNALRKDKEPVTFDRDEGPAHQVTLPSFYLQETEVSIGEFELFCADTTRKRIEFDVKPFFDEWNRFAQARREKRESLRGYPATGVSRRMAEEYARWIGGDLPTEAQWEFAARSGGKPRRYGWGDDPESVVETANVSSPEAGPFPVDSDNNKDKTEQGIYNMAGNVREWCRDAWGIYSSKPEVNPARLPAEGQVDPYYVIRGGSYETPTETARATWRSEQGTQHAPYIMKADGHQKDLGFRVVVDVMEYPADLGAQPQTQTTASRETRR
jgi:serine/threonine-protein kinase